MPVGMWDYYSNISAQNENPQVAACGFSCQIISDDMTKSSGLLPFTLHCQAICKDSVPSPLPERKI